MKSNWQILEIPQGSSAYVIKSAYRKLAHIHHPDKGGDAKKFSEINRAYSELTKNPSASNTGNAYSGGYSGFDYGFYQGGAWQESYQTHWDNIWKQISYAEKVRKQNEEMKRAKEEAKKQQTRSDTNYTMQEKIIRIQVIQLLNKLSTTKRKFIDGQEWYTF